VTIVGIAGRIAAGKSELAKRLVSIVGDRTSFGGYVRQVAFERGLSDDREDLQQLGEQLLDELGAREFTDRVLATVAGPNYVVDGVRHLAVSDALAARDDQYLLVFVELDDATRRQRLETREGQTVDLAALDKHSTERELPLLRARADLVVSGSESDSVGKVSRALRA
jgi:cytidylate kinase